MPEARPIKNLVIYGSGNSLYLSAFLIASEFYHPEFKLPFSFYCIEDPQLNTPSLVNLDAELWNSLKEKIPSHQDFFIHNESMIHLGESYEDFQEKTFYRFEASLPPDSMSDYLKALRHWYYQYTHKNTPAEYWQSFLPYFLSLSFKTFPFAFEDNKIKASLPHGVNIHPTYSKTYFKKACQNLGVTLIKSPVLSTRFSKNKLSELHLKQGLCLQCDVLIDTSCCLSSPFAKEQAVKQPKDFETQNFFFELPYPNALLPYPTLISHSIATPKGQLLLTPLLEKLFVHYSSSKNTPEEACLSEIDHAFKSQRGEKLQGSYPLCEGRLASFWENNIIYMGHAAFHCPSFFPFASKILWLGIKTFLANFPEVPIPKFNQQSFEKTYSEAYQELQKLKEIFIWISQDHWQAFGNSPKDHTAFLQQLQLSFGQDLSCSSSHLINRLDFDHFLYSAPTKSLYSPCPYFQESYYHAYQEKVKKSFNHYAKICQQIQSPIEIIQRLKNTHHVTYF